MNMLILLLIWLLNIYFWIIIATVIISWLVVFGVLNMRNKWVYKVCNLLDRAVTPVTNRLRRYVPAVGGIDLTPMILIFGIYLLQNLLYGLL